MYAVVGGGIAGLAAAHRLQRHGHEVQVYEAGAEVGGLAAVYDTPGDPIERFYHHLSTSEETVVELANDLDVGDRIEWRIGENAYYVDGVVHPLDKPWEILAFPQLSLYDKFRLGMLTAGIDVRGGIPSPDAYEEIEAFDDVPVREFLLEHATRNVYEQFFEPLLDAKFGDRKEDVSAAWLLGRLRFRGERDPLRGEILGYVDGSFKVILDALVDAIGRENITTGARVTDLGFDDSPPRDGAVGAEGAIDPRGMADPDGATAADAAVDRGADADPVLDGGDAAADSASRSAASQSAASLSAALRSTEARGPVESVTVETGAGTETVATDGVVVATMPDVLEELTAYTCDIDFQGAVCAVVQMDEPLTDTYWLNVAHDAPFGALIEHTNFVPPERYGGDHVLYVAGYVQSPDEWLWRADDDEVRERWLDHVGEMFPDFDRDRVREFRLARDPSAAPVYERGYLDEVVPYDLADEGLPGVYYAGMASRAQYPERSLDGGVVAGFECADRIAGSE